MVRVPDALSAHGHLRAVFFDAGLTLIHPVHEPHDLCVQVAARRGHPIDPTALEAALPRALAHFHQIHRNDPDLWASDTSVQQLWEEYYRYIFNELGILDDASACAAEVYECYTDPAAWRLFDDVLSTLEVLHARGLTIGVISDWASNLPSGLLLPLGIGRYIDFMVVSTIFREAKPGFGLYREALARAGVQPHEAVHIGDNYINDVLGARAAGVTGILLDRAARHNGNLDCPRITSLAELPALLGI